MNSLSPRITHEDLQDAITPAVVSKFCHDCRTPLAVVAEFANIISEDLGMTASPDVIEFLEIISDRTHEIEGLIADFQYLFKASQGDAHPSEVFCLGSLLRELKPELETMIRPQNKRVRVEAQKGGLLIRADRNAIMRSVKAVVSNLARVRNGDGVITVLVFADPHSGDIRLAVFCSTGASDEATPDYVVDAKNHAVPEEHELNFRMRMASLLLAANHAQLTLVSGAEHCALGMTFPISAEDDRHE